MSKDLDSAEAFEFYRSFLEFYARWFRPDSYLEIGLADGTTFRRLIPYCARLTGVDPKPMECNDSKCTIIQAESDVFFSTPSTDTYDLVFIDGSHESVQVLRDVRNSLRRLRPDGLIVAHDTFPPSLEYTAAPYCGDAYKAAIELRKDPALETYTFRVRFGLTLIGKIGTSFPWLSS